MEVLMLVPVIRSNPSFLQLGFEFIIPRELGVEKNTEKSRKYGEMLENTYYPVFEPTITNLDGILFVSSYVLNYSCSSYFFEAH